jgi:hypothetical protein
MTHFYQMLKKDLFKRIVFLERFLSAKDILAAAKPCRGRERIWTLMQTLWTFLVQVLNPDCSCQAAPAQLLTRGCDGVFRLQGARARTIDFRQGKRLGENDRLVRWDRPKLSARTFWPEPFALLPETLSVCILRFHTQTPGFRSRTTIVAMASNSSTRQ